jgi:multiple sugar transport system ATP-binding protein
MAFGLKLRKLDKAEIDRRVRNAAQILGLEEYLDRKPAALSGGQRQRVAMGRAIVRDPKAFLMDEPLSNLDAKLRVQMRSEIARIQDELGTTTIYVTHDQVEAMTMGDRVAVIRRGILQQVDDPQVLYDHPVNLFTAGFIGSPAMNMAEATLDRSNGSVTVDLGGNPLRVTDDVLNARPALKGYGGRRVVVGIRPEDIDDAALQPDAPADQRIRSTVVLSEALGSDVLVHFSVEAPTVAIDDAKELAADAGHDTLEISRRSTAGTSTFLARVNPRTRAREHEPIELVVDTRRMHFFDPETGLGIYGDD